MIIDLQIFRHPLKCEMEGNRKVAIILSIYLNISIISIFIMQVVLFIQLSIKPNLQFETNYKSTNENLIFPTFAKSHSFNVY